LAIPNRSKEEEVRDWCLLVVVEGGRESPLSLPSHFHSASTSLGEKVAYVAETACLALSYL
jgi:hypothetical protein